MLMVFVVCPTNSQFRPIWAANKTSDNNNNINQKEDLLCWLDLGGGENMTNRYWMEIY